MEQYENSAIYTLEQVADANALIDAFYKSKRGVSWKASVQKYELNLLKNTYKTRQRLLSGTYKASRFVQFPLSQRGKTRWIKSMHIRDRVVQRAVCDQVLLPKVKPYLIYDNGASLQGKGIDFALNRLEKHLHDHYKHYGDNKGQIVLIDFTKYFDNIPHDILKQRLIDDTEDEGLQKLLEYLFSLFQIDVRYLPDDIREEFIHGVYNSLKYSAYIKQQNPHHVKYNNCEKLKKGQLQIIDCIEGNKLEDEKLMSICININEDIIMTLDRYARYLKGENPGPFLTSFSRNNNPGTLSSY